MSIFDDPGVTSDYYLQHLLREAEWVERHIDEARQNADRDMMRRAGYNVMIAVEGKWLLQLLYELMAKHQIISEAQKTSNKMMSYIAMTRPSEFTIPKQETPNANQSHPAPERPKP